MNGFKHIGTENASNVPLYKLQFRPERMIKRMKGLKRKIIVLIDSAPELIETVYVKIIFVAPVV